jgi:hypothetical protein
MLHHADADDGVIGFPFLEFTVILDPDKYLILQSSVINPLFCEIDLAFAKRNSFSFDSIVLRGVN